MVAYGVTNITPIWEYISIVLHMYHKLVSVRRRRRLYTTVAQVVSLYGCDVLVFRQLSDTANELQVAESDRRP